MYDPSEEMTNLSLDDYLRISHSDTHRIHEMYIFLRSFLENFIEEPNDPKYFLKLEGIVDKFLKVISPYLESETKNISEAASYANRISYASPINLESSPALIIITQKLLGIPHRRRVKGYLLRLYTITMRLYNAFVASHPDINLYNLDLFDFYLPQYSDKTNAEENLKRAIDIIESDDVLTSEGKERVLKHINKAIEELHRKQTDWSRFFGLVKETIIILGAVGSIVGGQCALLQAKKTLEEVTQIVEKTSINVNYITLNQNQLTVNNNTPALPSSTISEVDKTNQILGSDSSDRKENIDEASLDS